MSASTGWVSLKMRCPACDKSPDARQWYHASPCGDKSYINEKARVECLRGGNGHSYPFKDWQWNCSNGNHGYKPASKLYVAAILNEAFTAVSEFKKAKDATWIFSLSSNLGRQCMLFFFCFFFCNF